MNTEKKYIIYDKIFNYITEELSTCIEHEIFNKISIEELGEFYYNKVLNSFIDLDEELLKAIIRTYTQKDIKYKNDYYRGLCIILGVKKLPSTMLNDVRKKYDEIFIQKYELVINKYKIEIDKINNQLDELKVKSATIKNTKSNHSFMSDISTDELRLYELSSQCNELRTRKEMLNFAVGYMNDKLMEFCDIRNTNSVEEAIMKEALELSKQDIDDVDSKFSCYKDIIEIVEDDIDRPYALFFKVKIYVIIENANKNYQFLSYKKSVNEALEEYEKYISLIPKIDDLNLYKNSNPNVYNGMLEKLIVDYGFIEELKQKLEVSVCLRERKYILFKAIELYEQGEYEIFNNILPIQIEGMFADYLRDTTTFLRFTRIDIYPSAVLKDKIRYLQEEKSGIYPEVIEYFMYYFNNMIRNRIAHGNYYGNSKECIQDEIFSRELILDMGMLVHMLSRKSETEKMYRFVHSYQSYYGRLISSSEHPCFGPLFNDIIGDKLICNYDTIEVYRPIQIAYWLLNPYYERIYEQIADKKELLELRKEFLSKEFWMYVLKELNDMMYKKVNIEFMSVVKGLFRYDILDETKEVLGKVNATLYKIKQLQEQGELID